MVLACPTTWNVTGDVIRMTAADATLTAIAPKHLCHAQQCKNSVRRVPGKQKNGFYAVCTYERTMRIISMVWSSCSKMEWCQNSVRKVWARV
jgi:hypothetical protein